MNIIIDIKVKERDTLLTTIQTQIKKNQVKQLNEICAKLCRDGSRETTLGGGRAEHMLPNERKLLKYNLYVYFELKSLCIIQNICFHF